MQRDHNNSAVTNRNVSQYILPKFEEVHHELQQAGLNVGCNEVLVKFANFTLKKNFSHFHRKRNLTVTRNNSGCRNPDFCYFLSACFPVRSKKLTRIDVKIRDKWQLWCYWYRIAPDPYKVISNNTATLQVVEKSSDTEAIFLLANLRRGSPDENNYKIKENNGFRVVLQNREGKLTVCFFHTMTEDASVKTLEGQVKLRTLTQFLQV